MKKTIAFVTNQHRCDRIINAALEVSEKSKTELMVVGVMDSEYPLDPEAVDYLFAKSKEAGASMRLLFTEDKIEALKAITSVYDTASIITGMPHSHTSSVYDLWRQFPEKDFYTVDYNGELVEVDTGRGKKGESHTFRTCTA